jgi:hypothetical protein
VKKFAIKPTNRCLMFLHQNDHIEEGTYMAGRNMFPTEKVQQEGAKAINYTFCCYPSYRMNEKLR